MRFRSIVVLNVFGNFENRMVRRHIVVVLAVQILEVRNLEFKLSDLLYFERCISKVSSRNRFSNSVVSIIETVESRI